MTLETFWTGDKISQENCDRKAGRRRCEEGRSLSSPHTHTPKMTAPSQKAVPTKFWPKAHSVPETKRWEQSGLRCISMDGAAARDVIGRTPRLKIRRDREVSTKRHWFFLLTFFSLLWLSCHDSLSRAFLQPVAQNVKVPVTVLITLSSAFVFTCSTQP